MAQSETRILIVDDNLMTRNVLAQHLQTMGFARINRAASCELAAHLLAEAYGKGEPFHLVLLDWHMPGMQGDKFVAQCRTDMRFGSVPIIMVTSEDDPGFILRALKTGATSYLVKPVSYGDLKKRIGQVLRKVNPKSV